MEYSNINQIINKNINNFLIQEGVYDNIKQRFQSMKNGYNIGNSQLQKNANSNAIMQNLSKWRNGMKKNNHLFNLYLNGLVKIGNEEFNELIQCGQQLMKSVNTFNQMVATNKMNLRKLNEGFGDKLQGAWQGFRNDIDSQTQAKNKNFRKKYSNEIGNLKTLAQKISEECITFIDNGKRLKKVASKVIYRQGNKKNNTKNITAWGIINTLIKYANTFNKYASSIINIMSNQQPISNQKPTASSKKITKNNNKANYMDVLKKGANKTWNATFKAINGYDYDGNYEPTVDMTPKQKNKKRNWRNKLNDWLEDE